MPVVPLTLRFFIIDFFHLVTPSSSLAILSISSCFSMSGVAVSYLGMMHMTLRSAIIRIVLRNTATFAHILFRCISLSSSKS